MDRKTDLFERCVLVFGAAVFAVLYAVCSQIDRVGAVNWTGRETILRFAGAFVIALPALYGLFQHLLPRCAFKKDGEEKPFRIWMAWGILFCCYVPMFLIVYPGSFTYDSMTQIAQIASGQYDAFHPLLHTLLIRVCLSLYDVFQSMEKCGAVYSIIQMLCVSGMFAYVCAVVSRCVSRRAAICSLLFFALYPSHFAFASNCTKDVLFSAFLAVFFALCLQEITLGALSGRQRAARLAAGALACLLRNNMVYAMAVWAVLLLLGGKRFLRIALCGVLSVALSLGVNSLLLQCLHADDGNVREMLSVPMQQLARARVYAPEVFDESESEYMDTLILNEAYKTYDPTISDNVKNNLNEAEFLADPARAAKLWLSVGRKCPAIYLDAFLNQTYASLYPYTRYMHNYAYIDIGSGTALTAPFGMPKINPPARFEKARQWLHEHLFKNGADDNPILRWIFNTGLVFWVLLAHVLYAVYRRNWPRVLLFMLAVLLWGTYLLGPIMYGRYLYPFICLLPMFVFRTREE